VHTVLLCAHTDESLEDIAGKRGGERTRRVRQLDVEEETGEVLAWLVTMKTIAERTRLRLHLPFAGNAGVIPSFLLHTGNAATKYNPIYSI
jgi:hypothetical protein